ncbi:hypothetical protein F5882DRAFT_193053 [Hyaloscypha sp. PMI_1271]|nr:hypothetical protein F5882DRAFT_193053 [Hyaloscypha sp. PMI_1271]
MIPLPVSHPIAFPLLALLAPSWLLHLHLLKSRLQLLRKLLWKRVIPLMMSWGNSSLTICNKSRFLGFTLQAEDIWNAPELSGHSEQRGTREKDTRGILCC